MVMKDPGRARQNSVATAVTNFTKPEAQNKGDLCTLARKREGGSAMQMRAALQLNYSARLDS